MNGFRAEALIYGQIEISSVSVRPPVTDPCNFARIAIACPQTAMLLLPLRPSVLPTAIYGPIPFPFNRITNSYFFFTTTGAPLGACCHPGDCCISTRFSFTVLLLSFGESRRGWEWECWGGGGYMHAAMLQCMCGRPSR